MNEEKIRNSGRYAALAGMVIGWVLVIYGLGKIVYLQTTARTAGDEWLWLSLALLMMGCLIQALFTSIWCGLRGRDVSGKNG